MLRFHATHLELPRKLVRIALLARDDRIVGIRLDRDPEAASRAFALEGRPPDATDPGPFRSFLDELRRYQAGAAVHCTSEVTFEGGSAFDRAIWCEIAEIPAGRTTTYGALARAVGRPTAARAVGGACGRNPIPFRVPCHRVLAAGGRLGGFSGEIATKIALLEHEGIRPRGVEPSRPTRLAR